MRLIKISFLIKKIASFNVEPHVFERKWNKMVKGGKPEGGEGSG